MNVLHSVQPHCYTPCNTAPELRSLLPLDPSSFQDPYCISITFLSSILTSNLNSIFRTPYTQPCPTLPVVREQGSLVQDIEFISLILCLSYPTAFIYFRSLFPASVTCVTLSVMLQTVVFVFHISRSLFLFHCGFHLSVTLNAMMWPLLSPSNSTHCMLSTRYGILCHISCGTLIYV